MCESIQTVYAAAKRCLDSKDPAEKLALTARCVEDHARGMLSYETDVPPVPAVEAGRPARPELVPPGRLPRRRTGSPSGRAALLHAIAHIEFNAINLAWDAVYRFRGLPAAYYADWIRIAGEEARHFTLLSDRLLALGYRYGDFPAHDGLWEMACDTAHDPMVRMALVPRVLEARGLDVTPAMIDRLRIAGDVASVEILNVILREEVEHVKAGSRWFSYLCRQRQLEPVSTFKALLRQYMKGRLKPPFHYQARREAGFDMAEMRALEDMAKGL